MRISMSKSFGPVAGPVNWLASVIGPDRTRELSGPRLSVNVSSAHPPMPPSLTRRCEGQATCERRLILIQNPV